MLCLKNAVYKSVTANFQSRAGINAATEMSCSLRLLARIPSVLRPLAILLQRLLSPAAGSRCDESSRGGFARAFRGEDCWERLPSAKHSARCWDHNHRLIMPHVAAYGILAVQSLFFFLGGIRQRSNHNYALIGRLLYAQVSATTS